MTIKSVLESSHKHFLLPLFSSIFLQLLLFTTLHFGNKFKKSRESLSELILVRVNPRQSPIPHTWPCVFSSSQRERPSSETCSGPTVDPSRAGPTVDPSRKGPSTGWKPIICLLVAPVVLDNVANGDGKLVLGVVLVGHF